MFNCIVTWLVAGLVFINAIPYTPAARYLLLGGLAVVSIIGVMQKHFSEISRSPIVLGASLFVGIALASALSSPYLIDSLQGFRKEYLPALLLLVVATSLRQTPKEKRRFATTILSALLAGFAIKTGLAIWDGAINHPFIFSPYSNPEFFEKFGLPKYVSYYAVESVLYIPITFSACLILSNSWGKRLFLGLLCTASLLVVLLSGIRSAFAAAAIGLLAISFLKIRNPKKILGLLMLVGITAGLTLTFSKNTTEIKRYADIVNITNYAGRDGMSGRYNIWEGVSELIEQRPALGYGPGWQKLPLAARDSGLLSMWQSDKSTFSQLKYWYFSLEPGKANPHNLVLQVLFETGWVGLFAYAFMLVALFWSAISAGRQQKTEFSLWLKAASIGYAASLLVIDVTNAFVFHNTMVAFMIITVLTNQSADKKTRPIQQ